MMIQLTNPLQPAVYDAEASGIGIINLCDISSLNLMISSSLFTTDGKLSVLS